MIIDMGAIGIRSDIGMFGAYSTKGNGHKILSQDIITSALHADGVR